MKKTIRFVAPYISAILIIELTFAPMSFCEDALIPIAGEETEVPTGVSPERLDEATKIAQSEIDLKNTPLGLQTVTPDVTAGFIDSLKDTAITDLMAKLNVPQGSVTLQEETYDAATDTTRVVLSYNTNTYTYIGFTDGHTEYYDQDSYLKDILVNSHSVLGELKYDMDRRGLGTIELGQDSITYDAATGSYSFSLKRTWDRNDDPTEIWSYTISSEGDWFKGKLEMISNGQVFREEEHILNNFQYAAWDYGRFPITLIKEFYTGYPSPWRTIERTFDSNEEIVASTETNYNRDGTVSIIVIPTYVAGTVTTVEETFFTYDSQKNLVLKATKSNYYMQDTRTVYQYDTAGNLISSTDITLPQNAQGFMTELEGVINAWESMSRSDKVACIQQLKDYLPAFSWEELHDVLSIWTPDVISADKDLVADLVSYMSSYLLARTSSNDSFMCIQFMAGLAKSIDRKDLLDAFIMNYSQRRITDSFEETPEHFEQRKQMTLSLWHDFGVYYYDRTNLLGYDTDHKAIQALRLLFTIYPQKYLRKLSVFCFTDMRASFYDEERYYALCGTITICCGIDYDPSWTQFMINRVFSNGNVGMGPGTFSHEMAHILQKSGTVANYGVFKGLSDSSTYETSPADFVSWYAGSNSDEDFAETVKFWFIDSIGLLNLAKYYAAQGKTRLLEKVMFVANLFRDDNGIVVGYRVDWNAPLDQQFTQFALPINTGVQGAAYPALSFFPDIGTSGQALLIYNEQTFTVTYNETSTGGYVAIGEGYYWNASVRADGTLESISIYQENPDMPGAALNSTIITFDAAGKLSKQLSKAYYADGTVKATDDSRYVEGVISAKYHTEFDTNGQKSRYFATNFNSSGLIKISDDYVYVNGIKTDRVYKTYDTGGVITRDLIVKYHLTGEINTTQDTYYVDAVKTKSYYKEYDPSGVMVRALTEKFHSSGSINTSDDYIYTNGIKTGRVYRIYDTDGYPIRDYVALYHATGKISTIEDVYYTTWMMTSMMTARYYEEYDTSGVLVHALTYTCYSSGTLNNLKTSDDYVYENGIKTDRVYKTYDYDGVVTREYIIKYHSTGKINTAQDTYYVDEIRTKSYFKECDPSGVMVRTFAETYDSSGRTNTSDEYIYTNGIKTDRVYKTYDTTGVITRVLIVKYHSTGEINTTQDTYYVDAVKTKSYYKEYDPSGVMVRTFAETYDSSGWTNTSDEYIYANGIMTGRTYKTYNEGGIVTRLLSGTFYSSGKKNSSDDRYYDAAGVITRYSFTTLDETTGQAIFKENATFTDGINTALSITEFTTAGVCTRLYTATWYPTGKPKTTRDTYYVDGIQRKSFYNKYDTSGIMVRALTETFYSSGLIWISDDYQYTIKKRYYREYNEAGELITSYEYDI